MRVRLQGAFDRADRLTPRLAHDLRRSLGGLLADVTLAVGDRQGDAHRPEQLLTLGLARGVRFRVEASGPDAVRAATLVVYVLGRPDRAGDPPDSP